MCFLKCPYRLRNPDTDELITDKALLGKEVDQLIPCLDPHYRGLPDDFLIRSCQDNEKLVKLKSGELDSNALALAVPNFQDFYPSQRVLELLFERAA